jgi:hypothetical protein
MSEPQIFNVLVEFFEEDEWDFQWMEGMSVLTMGFSGKNGKWQCFAQAREQQQQFVFYSVLPVNVPKEKRLKVAEFITRVNYGLVMGNFEMDFEDGEVRYKTSIDVEGAELSPAMIRQIVYSNIIITDRYLTSLMRVSFSDTTPEEAIEEGDAEALASLEEELAEFLADGGELDLDDDEDEDDEDDDDFFGDDDDFDDEDRPPYMSDNSPYSLN